MAGPDGRRTRATAIGFLAVLSWALLALLTIGTGAVPPFLLAALAFTVGGLLGLAPILLRPGGARRLGGQPAGAWALGILGLFGYHAAYFTALRNAPAAEASLIAYLWPLLIVLFAALLPGERLRLLHVVGALVSLTGAGLLVGGGAAFDPSVDDALGYAAALACALIWSSYSVASRRYGAVPTEIVAVFCLAAAALSALSHLAFEETRWPAGALEWAAVVGLGLGPVGGAFYAWDHGVKRGDIQFLGVASYAAPLLSTLVLVLVGIAPPTPTLGLAALLIVAGAGLAALASVRRTRRARA